MSDENKDKEQLPAVDEALCKVTPSSVLEIDDDIDEEATEKANEKPLETVSAEPIVVTVPTEDDIVDDEDSAPLITLDVSTDDFEVIPVEGAEFADEEDSEDSDADVTIIPLSSEEDEDADKKKVADGITAIVDNAPELSEGFKSRAAVIFEAAVDKKVSEEKIRLRETYESRLQESSENYRTLLTEKIDEYITTIVEEWVENNRVNLDNSLRVDIAEGFIKSLKGLLSESNIELPKSSAKQAIVKDLSGELSEAVNEIALLKEANNKLLRDKVLSECTASLTSIQSDKLRSLCENVSFTDSTSFKKHITELKDVHFSSKKPITSQILAENISDINKKAAGSLVSSTAACLDRL